MRLLSQWINALFVRDCQIPHYRDYVILHSHWQWLRVSASPHTHIAKLWNACPYHGEEMLSQCGFNLHFFKNEIGHHFTHLGPFLYLFVLVVR